MITETLTDLAPERVIEFPDSSESGRTRVRVSTLRRNDAVGKFLAFIRTGGTEGTTPAAE